MDQKAFNAEGAVFSLDPPLFVEQMLDFTSLPYEPFQEPADLASEAALYPLLENDPAVFQEQCKSHQFQVVINCPRIKPLE